MAQVAETHIDTLKSLQTNLKTIFIYQIMFREGRGLVNRSFCRHRCSGAEDRRAGVHGQGWSGCGGARIGW